MKRTLPPPEHRLPGPTQSATEPPPRGTPLAQPPEQQPFEKRFERLALIGEGGMGSVWRCRDAVLDRLVAVKILPADAAGHAALVEARFAARLQHPGITPVYETGVLPDGRQWLAMRELLGVDLDDLLRAADARPEPGALRRLLTVLHKVCEAMAYAHEQRTVHRDLKPGNIRIGKFGEVVVIDWGIAGPTGEVRAPAGTDGFMPPEQRDGAPLDPRMDVYALGQILARVLQGRKGPETPPLEALAARATQAAADARPSTAAALAKGLAAWLDGADGREEAYRLIAEAKGLQPKIEALRAEAATLEARAADILDALPAYAPTDQKAEAWALEDRARQLESEARGHEVTYESRLDEARRRSPEVVEARHLLAALYRDRVVEAERSQDARGAAIYTARLTEVDREHTYAAFLAGMGALTLVPDPPGAEVWIAPYVEQSRRLVVGEERCLGSTPLRAHAIERGSWRVRLSHPGRQDVIYPVVIERDTHWDGIPPGETEPLPIALPRVGEIGPDECYVPPGWFWSGGDPLATDGLPRRRQWVDGFVMQRFPMTYRAMQADLDRLWHQGLRERARLIAPNRAGEDPCFVHFVESTSGFRLMGADGRPGAHDWPVIQISWFAARAWARYRAEISGLPWRLPHSLEREKATRGTDRRPLPWGDFDSPTWANVVNSRPGPPSPATVNSYPNDISPYGVRGMAGNVKDWCIDTYTREGLPAGIQRVPIDPDAPPGAHQLCRGGGWASKGALCRAASRLTGPPDFEAAQVGVRLVRSWPAAMSRTISPDTMRRIAHAIADMEVLQHHRHVLGGRRGEAQPAGERDARDGLIADLLSLSHQPEAVHEWLARARRIALAHGQEAAALDAALDTLEAPGDRSR